MRTIILRFRYTLYFILFSIIPLTITGMSRDEDFSGGAATIFLIVCLPGIFISFFKAGVMAFKDLMNYAHGYAWPKDEHIFEDDVVNYFKNYTLDGSIKPYFGFVSDFKNKKGNIEEALKQLEKGIPVQYIVGEVDFYGSIFKINNNILIYQIIYLQNMHASKHHYLMMLN